VRNVLFEQEEDEGTMYGFTENYVKVKYTYQPDLVNTFQTIKLLELDRDGIMKCELVSLINV
jgi:threonylcarbamoyladenosine tRNA methylthiotransferase MtaB